MAEKCSSCKTARVFDASTCVKCGRVFPAAAVSAENAYWALLPIMRDMARRLGWCLALYGPLRRDFDMVAVPWKEDAVPHEQLLEEIIKTFGDRYSDTQPGSIIGRQGVTVICRKRIVRECGSYIDVSVVDPRIKE